MPTSFVKKLAKKKGMSIEEAEAKWDKAKDSVDRVKYSDDSSYYAVVTSVFKKMMREEIIPDTVLTFQQYLDERFGFSRSEHDANMHLGSTNNHNNYSSHVQSVRHNNPYASVDHNAEQRKHEVHGAAMQHVQRGDHHAAFAAAYHVAHAHAKADYHSDESAHDIATRKAHHAVKTAVSALGR